LRKKEIIVKVNNENVKLEVKTQNLNITEVIKGTAYGSYAVLIRYFHIVDLMINFFGKINVELSPRLSNIVSKLNQMDFPSISFMESSSVLKDGGSPSKENYDNMKEYDKNTEASQLKLRRRNLSEG
jgi:hypothetical protein